MNSGSLMKFQICFGVVVIDRRGRLDSQSVSSALKPGGCTIRKVKSGSGRVGSFRFKSKAGLQRTLLFFGLFNSLKLHPVNLMNHRSRVFFRHFSAIPSLRCRLALCSHPLVTGSPRIRFSDHWGYRNAYTAWF